MKEIAVVVPKNDADQKRLLKLYEDGKLAAPVPMPQGPEDDKDPRSASASDDDPALVLTDDEIARELMDLDGWLRTGDSIRKTYTFPDRRQSAAFLEKIFSDCNDRNHHPDVTLDGHDVTVIYTTHAVGDRITMLDIESAEYADEIAPDHAEPMPAPSSATRAAGGPGSGNFGHSGRPGQIGGSGEGGDVEEILKSVNFYQGVYYLTRKTAEELSGKLPGEVKVEKHRRGFYLVNDKGEKLGPKNRVYGTMEWKALGGPGSGNFGHSGRPGQIGGSGGGESDLKEGAYLDPGGNLQFNYDREYKAPSSVFRGITAEEAESIRKTGSIKSTGAFSHKSEGTSFAEDLATAESAVNFGRTNPAKTGKPNYVIQVAKSDDIEIDKRDYWPKAKEAVPAKRIEKVWAFHPDGRVEEMRHLGGPGSGNFGHAGRPGEVGGSTAEGGEKAAPTRSTSTYKFAGQMAAQISGKKYTGDDAVTKTIKAYHVTRRENVESILKNGFDLNKVKAQWQNDHAVSLNKGAKSASDYFSKYDPKTGKPVGMDTSKYALLEVTTKGTFHSTSSGGGPIESVSGAREYTRRMIAEGLDGQEFEGGMVYVHNPKSIVSIREVEPPVKKSRSKAKTLADITTLEERARMAARAAMNIS